MHVYVCVCVCIRLMCVGIWIAYIMFIHRYIHIGRCICEGMGKHHQHYLITVIDISIVVYANLGHLCQ